MVVEEYHNSFILHALLLSFCGSAEIVHLFQQNVSFFFFCLHVSDIQIDACGTC